MATVAPLSIRCATFISRWASGPTSSFWFAHPTWSIPDGALRDYEHHFHLPFKGFTKPIYAIPGNHDWYDALEGFSANFLEAEAARTCMRSRVETDGRLTSTTERRRIDRYIKEAGRLRASTASTSARSAVLSSKFRPIASP